MIRTVPVVPNGTLLDMGCGTGEFLVLIKTLGMKCYGVEPGYFDKYFVKRHGLKVFHGTLERANFPKDSFDAITLNHVFEHLPNPTMTLRELYKILKPGGSLVLAVPQSKSLGFYLFRWSWFGFDVPRHLFTHSIKTLDQYARKTGFSVKRIRFNSTPFLLWASFVFWANNFRRKPEYLSVKKMNKFIFMLLMPVSYLCNFLRIGDQVEVILEKPLKQND